MHSTSSVNITVLTPMTRVQAADLIERYLGSFPSLNLHNPEVYVAELCSLLISYPLWAGESAISTLKHTVKFPAMLAEAKPLLDEEVRIARRVQDMEEAARIQLARRNALRLEGPAKPPRPSLDELKAKYGPDWGITDPDKRRRKLTREQALGKLRAEFGDLVDTIPDAPVGNWKKGAI